MSDGFVYAIESGGAVKIGWAKDPVRRLSELNVGSPGAHRLLGSVAATKAQETELHDLLRPYRIRGEWFRNEGTVTIAINQFAPYHPKPKTVRTRWQRVSRKNKLHAYMKSAGITDAAMALAIGGCCAEAVKKWRYSERHPHRKYWHRIMEATGGAIMPNDFYELDAVSQ